MQIEASQQARVQTLRTNLLVYTDKMYDAAEFEAEFEAKIRALASDKLATAAYGPIMLVTLGRVYRLQVKRARGNIGAYFKCASPTRCGHTCLCLHLVAFAEMLRRP